MRLGFVFCGGSLTRNVINNLYIQKTNSNICYRWRDLYIFNLWGMGFVFNLLPCVMELVEMSDMEYCSTPGSCSLTWLGIQDAYASLIPCSMVHQPSQFLHRCAFQESEQLNLPLILGHWPNSISRTASCLILYSMKLRQVICLIPDLNIKMGTVFTNVFTLMKI